MNRIESFLNELKVIDFTDLGPARPVLEERIKIATGLLKNENMEFRTTKAPYFLNDLGVRYASAPSHFMQDITTKKRIILPTSNELCAALDNYLINSLPNALDAVVLLTGNFEAVKNTVLKRQQEILKNGTYILNIYAGTAAATLNDGDNGILFFEAAVEKAENNLDGLIAKHRLLATLLKRKRNFKLFDEMIVDIFLNDLQKISDYEKLQIIALLNNLLALRYVMDKDVTETILTDISLLTNSQQLLKESIAQGNSSNYDVSQSVRYTSQIAINQVQLLHKIGKQSDAVNILKYNLEIVKQNAPEYLSEAFGTYSYSLYLDDRFEEAIEYAKKGLREYSEVGNTRGIDAMRQILIGSFSKLDDTTNIKREIMYATTDKLGIKETIDDND